MEESILLHKHLGLPPGIGLGPRTPPKRPEATPEASEGGKHSAWRRAYAWPYVRLPSEVTLLVVSLPGPLILVSLALSLLPACSEPLPPLPVPDKTAPAALTAGGHHLVQLELTDSGARLVRMTPVNAPVPRSRRGRQLPGRWRAESLDAAGAVLHQHAIADPRTLHAMGPAGGLHVRRPGPVQLLVRAHAAFRRLRIVGPQGVVAEITR